MTARHAAKGQRVWINIRRFGNDYDLMGYMEGPRPDGGYFVYVPLHNKRYAVHSFKSKSEKDLEVVTKIMKS